MLTPVSALPLVDLSAAIAPPPLTLSRTDRVSQAIALIGAGEASCDFCCDVDGTARRLTRAHRSCVLVVEGDRLVGMVTEQDLLRLSASSQHRADMAIAEIMSFPVITLNATEFTDIFVPLNLFQQHSIHHLPLLDDQGTVVGLLTHESLGKFLHSIDLLHLPTAAAVMTTEVVHASPSTRLTELIQLMTTHRVSSVVIVDTVGADLIPIGIVTERDGVQLSALGLDFSMIQAQTIMSTPIESLTADVSLWVVQQWMAERQLNQVIITDAAGRLLGIVTQTNLFNSINPMAIYRMAERLIQERTQTWQAQVGRERLLAQIAAQIRASLNRSEVLDAAVTAVRSFLQCDRILVYQFAPDWSGVVVAESVGEGWRHCLGDRIVDSCFQGKALALYGSGHTSAIDNIHTEGYSVCHLKLLEPYEVKSNLVVPILVSGNLWGLLIGHQCGDYRSWQNAELTLLDEISVQLAIAIQQATAYEQAQTELLERQRTEAKLKASEERYRQIVETTLEGVWMIDVENRTSYVNPRMTQMLGYTADEMLGKTLFDFMDEMGQAQANRNLERRRQGIQEHHDFRFKTKTGEDIWTLIATNPLYDDMGNYVGALGMITDISDRKRAELEKLQAEKLRVELTILEDILDTILGGYWDADLVNATQYISPGFKRMFGYEDYELPNSPETWKTLVFPEDLPQAFEAYQRHVQSRGKIPYYVELRYRHKQGSTVWVICTGQVIKWDDEGNPLRLIGCHIDISGRKQAEAKLKQQADRDHLVSTINQRIRASLDLTEILNTTVAEVHQVLQTDRVLVYRVLPDGTGKTIAESVSPGWPVILDMVFPEEIFPRANYDRYVQGRIFALSDRETGPVLECLADFLRDLQVRAKLVVPIVENDTLWGLLIAHQCLEPRQWQTWEIDVLRQISSQLAIAIQQSQLYAQLQQSHSQLAHSNRELMRATRLKDEFLANMSHELRTPLNAILGMSESLQEEILGALNERQQKSVLTIERSGRHLLDLINDILELSKIEAGKLELDITTVSVAHLCKSSLSFVKQQAFKKQIQLNLTLPANSGEIALDERRIRQVLINLLSNAVKFTPIGGQVKLDVYREPIELNLAERVSVTSQATVFEFQPELDPCRRWSQYYLCLAVIDTGIGIAAAEQNKLFQPFVQVDSKLNRQYEGTGLGLALVKQIVELHGGDVSLQSTVGQGSCFTVRLPYRCLINEMPLIVSQASSIGHTPMAIASSSPFADVSNPESHLILLAEDNEANINTMSSYLEAKGYRIVVAKNGQEAIELTRHHRPDLILMDIQMPGVDGLEAMQIIRQDDQFAQVPIIALTALAMDGDREKCLQSGANDYIPKPVKLKQLTATIQTLLNRQ